MTKVTLFGISHDTYWPLCDQLLKELKGYQKEIRNKLNGRKSSRIFGLLITIFLIQNGFLPIFVHTQSSPPVQNNRQNVLPVDSRERLKAIYEGGEFATKSFQATWLPDGSGYIVLETNPDTKQSSLVNYEVISGKRTEMVTSSQLVFPGSNETGTIENFNTSGSGNCMLIQASIQHGESQKRQYWMFDLRSRGIQKVVAGRNNQISPDDQRILFSRQSNLHVYDLQSNLTIPLTEDGEEGTISYSRASWSPDGSMIAFVRSDVSGVRKRSSLIPGDPSFPGVRETRFARVGEKIATLSIGVADREGRQVKWLSIPIPTEGFYIGQLSWTGNSNDLLIEKLSRFRDKREFLIANVHSGEINKIYEEQDPAWVVASYRKNVGLEWIDNFASFLVLSEKDGWRHAYVNSRNEGEEQLITPGEFDIIERVAVDQKNGWFYYNASPENGTQKYLYRARLDNVEDPERITPKDQPGTHDYQLSPDAKYAFHTYSSWKTPPITELVRLPDHKVIRVLEDNKSLRNKLQSRKVQPKEFIRLHIGDGIVMDAWIIKPKDFDPTAKYPVFVYVYGEPHAQTVRDAWGHAMTEYHRIIADLGYLVVSIDNRGTPCPKGSAWRRSIAGSLGPLSTEEQAAALQELARTRSYVDLSRVGIWGWSGGGSNTLNAMFRKPEIYHVGIAVAPKPQPQLYNAWFQEIYMNTPEVNPDGYHQSAPINFAEGLTGDLLIIHGTGETNTHIQITEGLVDRLIELGKQFDYVTYPNRNHGLREGKGTSLHLRILMAQYLLTHLPPGPSKKIK